jgi:lipopolysaccharide biosynthesis protein
MIKPLAIYLPQYHSIPENNKAWGEGFTEWTNVRKAKPLFEGHYQPHEPHEDVGYYDLSDPTVLVKQADMAKKFGISGFAFYHYWFNGKRLLETPLDNMLKASTPDFPFLYIWANENWSKRWDGSENEIIQEQHYSSEDDLEHIRFLCKNVFSDKRYITIDDKPVFIVYRSELLPDIKETARIWREESKRCGYKDLYLVRVENFRDDINPLEIGFDAAMEFAPDVKKSPFVINTINENAIIDYPSSINRRSLKIDKNFTWFRCVYNGWDNSARKERNAGVFVNNSPNVFQQFFYRTVQYTKRVLPENQQFIFINAWNEWAEGCHIEPDKKNGYAYLNAVRNVLENKSNSNVLDYLKFTETALSETLKENERLNNELAQVQSEYKRYVDSMGHQLMCEFILSYKKVTGFFKHLVK